MNAPSEKLVADVKVLASDIEELVKATAAQSGEKLSATRARVQEALAKGQETLLLRGKEAAQLPNQYVHENPWEAVGITAALGILIGFLIGRR